MKEIYRLSEARQRDRLKELAASGGDVADISREICLARCLLEEALNSKNHLFANTLILTISKLAKAHEAARYRAGELLEKTIVLRLAARIVDIFAEEFFDCGEDAADRIERASGRLAGVIDVAANDRELV